MDVWKDIEPLRMDPEAGVEVILFGVLREMTGCRDARLVVSAAMLRKHLPRDGHSIRYQLEKLFALGCVHLLARKKGRSGEFVIRVWDPECRLVRRQRNAAQLELPLEWTAGVADVGEFLRAHPDASTDTISSGDLGLVVQEKPPADQSRIDAVEPQTPAGSAGDREAQTDASALPGRLATAGKSPRLSRGNPRHSDRGEIPAVPMAGKSPPFARISPVNRASGDRPGNLGEGETAIDPASKFPDGDFPAIAPRARASLNEPSKEGSLLNVLTLNEFNGSMNSTLNDSAPGESPGARAGAAAAVTAPVVADPEAAALQAILDSRRAALGIAEDREDRSVRRIATAAKTLLDRREYSIAKQRLETEILGLVCDRGMGRWLAGFAADLLLVHGANPAVYEAANRVLQELRDLREVQRRYGQKQEPRGAWLNKKVHALCDAHGIVTPARAKLARKAVPR